ncbi:hypothetical protein AHiyo1_38090 [Arthrobacter sp. Hiyo1]|nr:hypothetical protein AHiyo1_38090 [Arthrobacter sp. Hiyo1]
MTPVSRCTPSSTGAPSLPIAFNAMPKTTAMKMIWRISPAMKGWTMLVGMMLVRNCHHSWCAPASMSFAAASVVLMVCRPRR